MENETLFIIIGICCCLLPLMALEYYRFHLDRVFKFRVQILHLASNAAQRRINDGRSDWKEPYQIFERHSDKKMLCSFKRLNLKAWFTPEEIEILNEGADVNAVDSQI